LGSTSYTRGWALFALTCEKENDNDMNLEAIYHRAKLNWSYAYDDQTLHIRIRTKRADINQITLFYGDKYDWSKSNDETTMARIGSDVMFDYWEASAQPKFRRTSYYFALHDGERMVYFLEKGFFDESPVIFYEGLFDFPFLNSVDVHRCFIRYSQKDSRTVIRALIQRE
jgi:cyclomaltodextrinase